MNTVASLRLHVGEWVFGAHTHTTKYTAYRSPWEGLLEVAHSEDSIRDCSGTSTLGNDSLTWMGRLGNNRFEHKDDQKCTWHHLTPWEDQNRRSEQLTITQEFAQTVYTCLNRQPSMYPGTLTDGRFILFTREGRRYWDSERPREASAISQISLSISIWNQELLLPRRMLKSPQQYYIR